LLAADRRCPGVSAPLDPTSLPDHTELKFAE
jgi:hypothetical protein